MNSALSAGPDDSVISPHDVDALEFNTRLFLFVHIIATLILIGLASRSESAEMWHLALAILVAGSLSHLPAAVALSFHSYEWAARQICLGLPLAALGVSMIVPDVALSAVPSAMIGVLLALRFTSGWRIWAYAGTSLFITLILYGKHLEGLENPSLPTSLHREAVTVVNLASMAAFLTVMWITYTQQKAVLRETLRTNARLQTAQAALSKMHREKQSELQSLVNERTQELETAMLKAQAADRSKSDFVAKMSHEIRTPLNAVMGYADLLKFSGKLGEKETHYVKAIQHGGEHLIRIIDDVLDLSRIQAGKLKLNRAWVDVEDLIESALELVVSSAMQKGLTIRRDIHPGVPQKVWADGARVRQMLINLLSNATKFTELGEILISVRKVTETAAATKIQFTVSDTGIGIPPEQLEAIFENFHQIAPEHNRTGTGLGLPISRHLANLHGGHAWAEDSVQGSCVHFTITSGDDSSGEAAQVAVSHPDFFAFKRALVVDDNELNLSVASLLLEHFSIESDQANDGEEAVGKFDPERHDLILLDLMMPGMSGLQVAKNIRSRGDSIRQPFILGLTALAMPSDRQSCIDAGMNGHLAKPLSLDRLSAALREVKALPTDHA